MDVTSATAAQTAAQASGTKLAGDFDTFLTLLTTQLKNQDPLSPLDTNEFTQQLVSFSGVEQSIQTNKNLEALLTLSQEASSGTTVSYLGKTVTAVGNDTMLKNSAATWEYELGENSATTHLVISDAAGKVVFSGPGEITAGKHSFTWDGKDNTGNQLPDGLYSIQATAIDAEGDLMTSPAVMVRGLVTGIDLESGVPTLKLGEASYTLGDLLAIEENVSQN